MIVNSEYPPSVLGRVRRERDELRAEVAALRQQLDGALAKLGAIDDMLRECGIEYPLGAAGVRDLAAMAAGRLEELQEARRELEHWRSGRRRKGMPVVESVPDGLHYAAELVRAQGTEGGEEHDRLLVEAGMRLKGLHDAAAALLVDRDRLLDVYRAAEAALTDAQAAANAVFNQEIGIGPEIGARQGWFKAECWVSECGWSTTGSEPVVEDEGHQHIAGHRDLVGLAESAIELIRIPLRAKVDAYRAGITAEAPDGERV